MFASLGTYSYFYTVGEHRLTRYPHLPFFSLNLWLTMVSVASEELHPDNQSMKIKDIKGMKKDMGLHMKKTTTIRGSDQT